MLDKKIPNLKRRYFYTQEVLNVYFSAWLLLITKLHFAGRETMFIQVSWTMRNENSLNRQKSLRGLFLINFFDSDTRLYEVLKMEVGVNVGIGEEPVILGNPDCYMMTLTCSRRYRRFFAKKYFFADSL